MGFHDLAQNRIHTATQHLDVRYVRAARVSFSETSLLGVHVFTITKPLQHEGFNKLVRLVIITNPTTTPSTYSYEV